MEEAHRTHKEVPVGWVATLLSMLALWAERRAIEREATSLMRERAKRTGEFAPPPHPLDRPFLRGW
jgi:hypothetical protein